MNRKATLSSLVGILATTLLLTVLTSSVAQAQPKSFAENFNNPALPATLEESGGSPIYPVGVVIFPGAFNSDRRYLRTLANYDTTSFTAEVSVTVSSPFIEPHIGFIGFGAGVPNPWFYSEPMTAPDIYVRVTPTGFGSAVTVTNGNVENINTVLGAAGDGTHRVRITWNHVTKEFTVAIHQYYAGGPFVPTTTLAPVVATNAFGPTNSRIFFGGHGVTFDDLVVFTGLAGTPGQSNCHGQSVSALALAYGSIENAALVLGFPSVDALQDYIKTFCRID